MPHERSHTTSRSTREGGPPASVRELTAADHATVLELNRASVRELSAVDEPRLEYLLACAYRSLVVERAGTVVAFALSMAPAAGYDGRNYRWFEEHLQPFLYLDRIAVAHELRRLGIGALLYEQMEDAAAPFGRMVCEVNVLPPNDASLAFHAARGYVEIARLTHPEKVVALMSKELG